MRKLTIAIAVAALVAGCGSSGSKSTSVALSAPKTRSTGATTTRSAASTATVSPSPTYRYPAAAKSALMADCRRNGSRSACNCVVRYFEGNFAYAQIKAASIPKLATWAAKAASICSGA
jgi:uncharacterized protein YceK